MSLNITFVTETYRPEVNGVAMTVGRLVDGMRERGHRVSIVRPRQSKADFGCIQEIAVRGWPLPGYPGLRFGLPAGTQLSRQWRQQRPDLVHVVTEGPLGWSAVNTARRMGITVTSGFHTNFDRYSVYYGVGWLRSLVSAYLRSLHRRTMATMVPTEALAAALAGEGLAGVRVVGRGVDSQLFDPARRSAALRASWGVPANGLACLYVGRIAAEKNLALALKTFEMMRLRRPEVRMIWVGDGPSAKQLQADYPDHYFAGTCLGEDLAAHYASADLFLFPSLTETYGNVVAEAMASGLPVLAYRSAAAAELIVDGANGRVVGPGDESAYISTALQMLGDPAGLAMMGLAARDSMMSRNWANVVERFENVAREAMQG